MPLGIVCIYQAKHLSLCIAYTRHLGQTNNQLCIKIAAFTILGRCATVVIHASYVTTIMLAIFCIMLAPVGLLEWLPALLWLVVRDYLYC